MHNYITGILFIDKLVAKHRTTIVGTLRKNKRQISPYFSVTMFGFGEKKVLISYVPNKKQKSGFAIINFTQ